jgi:hypothetical protein
MGMDSGVIGIVLATLLQPAQEIQAIIPNMMQHVMLYDFIIFGIRLPSPQVNFFKIPLEL